MNEQAQCVRKINAALRLESALQIIQNEIGYFDPASTDVEISTRGRKLARR